MATKKKDKKKGEKKDVKKAAKKVGKKAEAKKTAAPKDLPVSTGPVHYTTSNTFKASIPKVWAAAVEKKHLKKHFLDDMKGDFAKDKEVGFYWKDWGWWTVKVLKYSKNKELEMLMPDMTNKYMVTVRYEILKKDGQTIFRIHESGYPQKDLNMAFMMCEGWSEFHTAMKAHLLGVDVRKA